MNTQPNSAPRSRYAGVTSVDFRLVTDDEDPDVPNVLHGNFQPTAEPNRGPSAAIAQTKNVRGLASLAGDDIAQGLGKDGQPVKLAFKRTDLATLFESESTKDAHFVCYVVEKDGVPLDRQPRLTKQGLDAVRRAGFDVNCGLVAIDQDLKDLVGRSGKIDPPKLRWVELTDDENALVWQKVEAALATLRTKGMHWCASYNTQAGLRFINALAIPVAAGASYEALVARFLDAHEAAGLKPDRACEDWTRLFAAPRITKESGLTTYNQEWSGQAIDLDDDSAFYVPTDEDLEPAPVAPAVEFERVSDAERPDPNTAMQLVEFYDDATRKMKQTPAALAAKRALADSDVAPWIYGKLPLAFPGNRNEMLTRAMGTVVGTLHGIDGITPAFIFGLLYEPAARLDRDGGEEFVAQVWRQAVDFWNKETMKKAQAAASAPSSPSVPAQDPASGPVVLSEPQGMNAAEWLGYMNQRHAVVRDFGGKCRVIGWRNEHGRDVLYHQSFDDVRRGYSNRRVRITVPKTDGDGEDVVKYHEAGKWWLDNRERRQFERVLYAPGQPQEFDGCLNLWKGWGVAPAPGDWSLMRRHVVEVLAAGNAAHADYILRWAAWAVQNPGRVAEVALVFRGGEGTGKGTFARAMKDLFGQHGVHISSSLELTGRFNSHMRDCSLLFADEAVAPEDRDAVGRLKAMVTEPTIRVEQKGVDSQEFPNCLHVIMASNERWVVPAGEGDRRFVVFDVSEAHKEDRDWFDPLFAQLDAGGLAAMLHDLLAMDLGNWHPRQARPKTDAHAEQKAQSLRGVDRLWFDCLTSGELPAGSLLADGTVKVRTRELLDQFASRTSNPNVNKTSLGMLLSGTMVFEGGREAQGGKATFVVVPALAQARQRWNEKRFPFPWPPADGWSAAR